MKPLTFKKTSKRQVIYQKMIPNMHISMENHYERKVKKCKVL